jgi:hypothetical protein
MDTSAWHEWNEATGPKKARLMTALLAKEATLIKHFATRFLNSLRLDATNMYADDVFQAARLGVFLAIQKWEPLRGSFLTCAWGWTRLEMQKVMAHAAVISYPRSLLFDGGFQNEIATFYAKHGRDPLPEEIDVPQRKRAAFARVRPQFGPIDGPTGSMTRDPLHRRQSPEEMITPEPRDVMVELEEDRNRDEDLAHLNEFLETLPKADKKAMLAGKRPSLRARAQAYVVQMRGVR